MSPPSDWELPENGIRTLFHHSGPSFWLWDTKVRLGAWKEGRMLGSHTALAGDMEDENLPISLQEVRAKNSIPLIRSFPPLPLLPRGGVGMGFVAGVGGRISQA